MTGSFHVRARECMYVVVVVPMCLIAFWLCLAVLFFFTIAEVISTLSKQRDLMGDQACSLFAWVRLRALESGKG